MALAASALASQLTFRTSLSSLLLNNVKTCYQQCLLGEKELFLVVGQFVGIIQYVYCVMTSERLIDVGLEHLH